MDKKKTKDELEKEIADAVVRDPSGAALGHRVVGPAGQMVLGKGICLAASVAQGYYVEGLKDGWRLADAKEEAAVAAAAAKSDALAEAEAKKADALAASIDVAVRGLMSAKDKPEASKK
ncbi:MAG TPA: hypothetical protein VMY88_01565 [Acidimicrobiales bacterium]|nr:hypothetical protein [Acidimicrobiales bacterium]